MVVASLAGGIALMQLDLDCAPTVVITGHADLEIVVTAVVRHRKGEGWTQVGEGGEGFSQVGTPH